MFWSGNWNLAKCECQTQDAFYLKPTQRGCFETTNASRPLSLFWNTLNRQSRTMGNKQHNKNSNCRLPSHKSAEIRIALRVEIWHSSFRSTGWYIRSTNLQVIYSKQDLPISDALPFVCLPAYRSSCGMKTRSASVIIYINIKNDFIIIFDNRHRLSCRCRWQPMVADCTTIGPDCEYSRYIGTSFRHPVITSTKKPFQCMGVIEFDRCVTIALTTRLDCYIVHRPDIWFN